MLGSEAETRPSLLFIGDVFCDLIFTGTAPPRFGQEVYADRFAIAPGGEAIHTVAAARLGATSHLIATMGDDPVGTHVRDLLTQEPGVDLAGVTVRPEYQTPVSVSFSGPDDRGFITYTAPHVLHTDTTVSTVDGIHVALDLADRPAMVDMRARGARVVCSVGWDPTGSWSPERLTHLSAADVFIVNDVEAMAYTRADDPFFAARRLAHHVPLAIVTRGADGVVAVDSATGTEFDIPAVRVQAVDPTGAGDVFTASFMVTLTKGWDLATRLRYATAASAYSVTHIGGASSAPTTTELAEFVSAHRLGPLQDLLAGPVPIDLTHRTTPSERNPS